MLPPVNAVANSSIAFQDPRTAQDGAQEGRGKPVGQPLEAANGLERNAAIAGRLNLLMLSGQERMSDNLTILVNLLGSRLGMERGEGETLSAFAGRLVQALADASPQIRQSVQRQLAQMFGGLQLRTLIEAFRNPVGPEAATLTIYLELYRAKDRDLAARSVVTSYRQNGGEARHGAAPTPAQAAAGRATAGSNAQGPAATPLRSEAATGGPLASTGEPGERDGLEDPMAPVAKGRLFGMQDEQSRKILKLAAARAMQTAMFHGAQPAQKSASEGAQASLSPAAGAPAVSAEAAVSTPEPAGSAPMQHPDDRQSAAASANAEQAEATDESARAPKAERTPTDAANERNPTGRQKDRAGDADRTQILYVLKGWQEDGSEQSTNVPLPAPEDIIPDPARLIAHTVIDDARAQGSMEAETAARDQAALATDEGRTPDPEAEALEQLAEPEGQASTTDRGMPDVPVLTQVIPDAEVALARPPFAARDGIPLPLVNYLFAADDIEGEKGVKHRFSRDDGDSGEHADQGFGDDARDEAADGDRGAEDEQAAEPYQSDAPATGGETANDLYWRMAGWS